jgi:myosin heavy chain 6/7
MSPTTASRLENRVKELEEALEQERSAHLRTEKELTEIRFSFESLRERLDESEAETSSQIELNRRKDLEFLKVKKDLDLLTSERESSETTLKKRFTEQVNELTEQLERANKLRAKIEKEKQNIVIEIETYTSQLDTANKAKTYAESRVVEQDESLRKLKAQNDDLTRANLDLTSAKSRLTQEVTDIQRHLSEVETNFGSSSKVKIQLQHQVDEVKAKYEEESRVRTQLEIQYSALQDEVSGLKSALDEEAEAANSFKGQAAKWQTDFAQLKAKYDKDVVLISDEFEEIRRKSTLRITELETELEQQKARAARLEKEKSKLTIEINELVVNLEAADGAANETAKRLKQAEHAGAELQKHVDELSVESRTSGADRDRLTAEVSRLKQLADDLQNKLDILTREHAKLHETVKESEGSVRDLTRQSGEWSTLRLELISERDALGAQLSGAHDALNDLQGRLDGATTALNQGKADLEARLRDKDDEIENVRRASGRQVEEAQRALLELEARSKSEAGRLKKKYESEIQEITLQIDVLNRTNG